MTLKSLQFYLARLRKSSPGELLHRFKGLFFAIKLKRLSKNSKIHVHAPVLPSRESEALMPSLTYVSTNKAIRPLLSGDLFTLNGEPGQFKASEELLRGTFFYDVNTSRLNCDIRALWEPARLQNVTVLFASSDLVDAEAATDLREYCRLNVLAWLDSQQFLFGPHYLSVMECGLRIPVFFYCIKYVSNLTDEDLGKLFDAVYQHAWLIEKRLSLYSSLGNHTVCEAMGLVFAGGIYRELPEGKRWLSRGLELLRQEITHQVLPDGGPVEQSLNYHRFVLDIYWLTVAFLEKNDLADCHDWKPRLLKGEEFLAAFMDKKGNFPAIGDSDDGFAVAPGLAPKRGEARKNEKEFCLFPDAGYSIFRFPGEAIVTFDHGPLGMAPLYNHGHADALSITLTKYGKPLLVDPGTYRYNGVPEWRRYFKGTRAHNTVCVDGCDQAVQETSFIWSRPYTVKVDVSEGSAPYPQVRASHSGYGRLKQPVTHRRSLWSSEGLLFIEDDFEGRGEHSFELNFHLHPEAEVLQVGGWMEVSREDAAIYLVSLKGDEFGFVRGQSDPILGWYSPAYGVKQESGVLQCLKKGSPGEVSFMTVIATEEPKDLKGGEGVLWSKKNV